MTKREQLSHSVWKIESASSEKVYEVKLYVDGTSWCDCPAYRFQKVAVADRKPCKHVASAMRAERQFVVATQGAVKRVGEVA